MFNEKILYIGEKIYIRSIKFNFNSLTMPSQIILSLEGTIGAGKTTLLSYLDKFDNICVIPEPIEDWTLLNGLNPLKQYYKDKNKYGFAFQMLVLTSQIEMMKKAHKSKCDIVILERCAVSNYNTFYENMRQFFDPVEQAIYENMYKRLATENIPNGYIYLNVDTRTAMNRIKVRSRSGEDTVTQQYLETLNLTLENFLEKHKDSTLVIDGNREKSTIVDYQQTVEDIVYFSEYLRDNKGRRPKSRQMNLFERT